jgi:hypothetical protein
VGEGLVLVGVNHCRGADSVKVWHGEGVRGVEGGCIACREVPAVLAGTCVGLWFGVAVSGPGSAPMFAASSVGCHPEGPSGDGNLVSDITAGGWLALLPG